MLLTAYLLLVAWLYYLKHYTSPNLTGAWIQYCRFGNFRENFIIAKSIKRHISDVNNSRLRQDLPIDINKRRVILRFFTNFRENNVLAKKSEFTVFPVRKRAKISLCHILRTMNANKGAVHAPRL